MKKSGQNIVAVVVLLFVIAVAIAFVIKVAMPKRSPRPMRPMVDWTCEACSYRFVAQSQAEPTVCPKCSGEAVRTHYYYCSVHAHVFEAYRKKPNPDAEPGIVGIPELGTLHKVPGGEWTEGFVGEVTCPQGNSDRATIKSCPPGSEYRE